MTLDTSPKWLMIEPLMSAAPSLATQTTTKLDCSPATIRQETLRATESTVAVCLRLAVVTERIPTIQLSVM